MGKRFTNGSRGRQALLFALTLLWLALGPAPGHAQSAEKERELGAALLGADLEAAQAAARQLGAVRHPRALGLLLDGLALGLHPSVAVAALEAVGQYPQAQGKSFDTLDYYRNHRRPEVRAAAVGALGALGDRRAAALVVLALRDPAEPVRAAAAAAVAARRWRQAGPDLLALLEKGDAAAAPALAAVADAELARGLAERSGRIPDDLLARALGGILRRGDFGPEAARVQIVRALGKLPGDAAVDELSRYVESVPARPARASRTEAVELVEARHPAAQKEAE